ncbi:MAG: chemotaxis protein CheB [Burkholderiales bacterium]
MPAKTVRSKDVGLHFPVVGIGASAGGLEAFEQFFRNTPADIGMAFVLVSHLDPNYHSILTEILQRATAMKVTEAVDKATVQVNHVYVIPPNRVMVITGGKLQLSAPVAPRGQRMPIDTFLTSLGEDQGKNAVGIILSGTGSDGTAGLQAIIGTGGTCLVQDPATAKFEGMPTSAINAGVATDVLPVEKMAERLIGIPQPERRLNPESSAPDVSSGALLRVLSQVRTATGHDLAQYKKSTIIRRIERRMAIQNIEDMKVYAQFLKENPREIKILFDELLINVTSFFRDPDAFEHLRINVLPSLCNDRPENAPFRVWVAGCSSGEEAYSIAILLRECMSELARRFTIQVYATDIDEDAIAFARAGIYPATIAQDVTQERLDRFFIKEGVGYRVKKDVREMVVFAVQSIVKDPPFTKLDLLSCRNLMIYLESELQNRLISMFHYALKPGGVLFLSPSEGIGNHTELFSVLNRKWKFYAAIPSVNSARTLMTNPLAWVSDHKDKMPGEAQQKPEEVNFIDLARRLLIQYFAPPSLITDRNGNIFYIHGDTGKYLRPAPGITSANAFTMAREGLESELRAAVTAAADSSSRKATLNREAQVKTNGSYTPISLSVRPLPDHAGGQGWLLISFQDVANAPAKPARKRLSKSVERGLLDELQQELSYTRENLQANVEEQQASNEELKSTNEEMQSTNEELQSTNEELETSKEELQSINEELITVNAELQSKIEQLGIMQNDMKNLFDNMSICTIFLDQYMVIRRFSRDAARVYRLVGSDVGRSLADIKCDFERENLLTEAQKVLDTLIPFEREMCGRDGVWFLVRIQPYRTLDNVIDGVVMTFADISARIEAETTAHDAQAIAENTVAAVREPLLVLDADLQVVTANLAFCQYFQVKAEDTIGHRVYDLGNGQWNIPALRKLLDDILPTNEKFERYVVESVFPGIGARKIVLNARRIVRKKGDRALILLAMEVTTRDPKPTSR